ncbi:MAG TPA: penicillin-binding protein activator [Longimicrobiales bacterium]|nr:penicillin-binding protein activator [Longimicrobiales bacterium]
MKPFRAAPAERRRILPALVLFLLSACTVAGPAPETPPPARDAPPREPVREAPLVRLGVVLPQGGALQPYATAVLEGIRVAAADHERTGAHRVELEVRDASTREQVSAAVRELAAAGVVAIIGPLLEENVGVAARARPDPGLLLISPTATQNPGLPNAYALNVSDTLGAAALARHAASRPGATGVLYARTPDATLQAQAFRHAYRAASGDGAPIEIAYSPGTTTYAAQVRQLRDAGVRTLLLVGVDTDVRQILPQLRYYGLEADVLGTGPWTTPDGIRAIGIRELEGAVLAVPFLEEDPASGWQRFRHAYEQTYRRSLENAIPALGHDAALLVLGALPDGRVDADGARRALSRARDVSAATGRLVVAGTELGRAPQLVQVREGRLVPLP